MNNRLPPSFTVKVYGMHAPSVASHPLTLLQAQYKIVYIVLTTEIFQVHNTMHLSLSEPLIKNGDFFQVMCIIKSNFNGFTGNINFYKIKCNWKTTTSTHVINV